jgi:asparagine synthase (glutamine-hydrolysing)
MCGIFGLAGRRYADQSRERQARTLARRGPDGFGEYVDDAARVYLAHTRLAIIDLSPRGAQPMCNEDGTVWVTFNGEIYGHAALRAELEGLGHRFASDTDTEVIVHAYEQWGIDCLARLNGMFAFGLWDARRGKLFLVRDRLGIKPLYWGIFDGTLAFASDSRALVGLPFVPRELDPAALVGYLLYSYVSGEQAIWKGVHRLLPGHMVEYDPSEGRVCVQRYWSLPLEQKDWRLDDALERFSTLFSASVRDCLVSDVPLGIFLSGGYDSSAVAREASAWTRHLHTYSIGFSGWPLDERAAAATTAASLGTNHRAAVLGPEQFATLDEVIGAYDEPLADSSIFPTFLLCREVRQQATVAVSGDGGDELLGGYRWYQHMVYAAWHKRMAMAMEPLVQAAGLGETPWGQRCSATAHYRMLMSPTFTVPELRRLLPGLPKDAVPDDAAWLYRSHMQPALQGFRRWQFVDLQTFLVDNNLAKVDRASMAHGLEVRVPFLDHRIAEFAFSLPDRWLGTRHEHKVLLRHWLRRHGMQQVVDRPKQGFSSPWQTFWPTAAMVEELRGGWLAGSGLVDPSALESVLATPHVNRDPKLLALTTLNRWAQQCLG